MYRNSYHLIAIHEPPSRGSGQHWIAERLADARADLLHRLGLGSAGLRLRGLRLLLEPPPPPLTVALPAPASLGITLRVTAVDEQISIVEALHAVTDIWHHHWRGDSLIRVADGDIAVPLPADLRRRAATWLGLERGAVPLQSSCRQASSPG